MKKIIVPLFVLMVILCSCTTSKSVVSNSADLSKYQYAALSDVMDYSGPPTMMDIEVHIYNALEQTRLQIIGERSIHKLTDEQQERLLLVKYSAYQDEKEAIVSANFTDYNTGKPVASCRGTYALGIDYEGDLKGAIKQLANEFRKLF